MSKIYRMLPFFPTPYPDELFYSLCARYKARSFHTSSRNIAFELFRKKAFSSNLELPSQLQVLCTNLPTGSLTVDHLIQKHTFFPLFSPFLTSHRRERVFSAMIGVEETNQKELCCSPFNDFNWRTRYLRFCPSCIITDEERFGEPYWHRSHQVYGSVVCHRHECALLESKVSSIAGRDLKLEHLSREEVLNGSPVTAPFADRHLFVIAREIHWLLNRCHHYRHDLNWIQRLYLAEFQKAGYASVTGFVDIGKLTRNFINFYGKTIREALMPYDLADGNWLENLLYAPGFLANPLCHILLISFLGRTCREFLWQMQLKYEPFGQGPWPCLNPVAKHYRLDVVQNCALEADSASLYTKGIFSCSCGFVYSRHWPDRRNRDHHRFDVIEKYGTEWDAELTRLRDKEQLSFTEIGKRLMVSDIAAHLRYDEITGNAFLSNGKISIEIKQKKMRKQLLHLKSHYPSLTRSKLCSLDRKVYNWLIKYDRVWLDKVLGS